MTEVRIKNPVTGDCGPVPVSLWTHPGLSFKAKVVAGYLLSRPPGFLPRVGQVERTLGLGRDARRAAYEELRAAGLLETRAGCWSVARPEGGAA